MKDPISEEELEKKKQGLCTLTMQHFDDLDISSSDVPVKEKTLLWKEWMPRDLSRGALTQKN